MNLTHTLLTLRTGFINAVLVSVNTQKKRAWDAHDVREIFLMWVKCFEYLLFYEFPHKLTHILYISRTGFSNDF